MVSRMIEKIRRNMLRRPDVNNEAGEASMMTVAMFSILFTAIAVSFTFLVSSNYRTSTNDTLQYMAKAAAESGIEDAKRLLVKCLASGADRSATSICSVILNKTVAAAENLSCDYILGDDRIGSLRITKVDDSSNQSTQARIGNNDQAYDERYQCLKIATLTKDVQYKVQGYSSDQESTATTNGNANSAIIPLKFADGDGNNAQSATSFTIRWHRLSNDENDPLHNNTLQYPDNVKDVSGQGIPTAKTWEDKKLPAFLRVEIVHFSDAENGVGTGTTIDELGDNDAAVTLRPNFTNSTEETALSIYSYQSSRYQPSQRSEDADGVKNSIIPVNCKSGSIDDDNPDNDGYSGYSCQIRITDRLDFSNNTKYYLRVTPLYGDTTVILDSVKNDSGSLYFKNVQPVVDVTGVVSDSYVRLRARLSPSSKISETGWFPPFAIETNGKVCKDMDVENTTGKNHCE